MLCLPVLVFRSDKDRLHCGKVCRTEDRVHVGSSGNASGF